MTPEEMKELRATVSRCREWAVESHAGESERVAKRRADVWRLCDALESAIREPRDEATALEAAGKAYQMRRRSGWSPPLEHAECLTDACRAYADALGPSPRSPDESGLYEPALKLLAACMVATEAGDTDHIDGSLMDAMTAAIKAHDDAHYPLSAPPSPSGPPTEEWPMNDPKALAEIREGFAQAQRGETTPVSYLDYVSGPPRREPTKGEVLRFAADAGIRVDSPYFAADLVTFARNVLAWAGPVSPSEPSEEAIDAVLLKRNWLLAGDYVRAQVRRELTAAYAVDSPASPRTEPSEEAVDAANDVLISAEMSNSGGDVAYVADALRAAYAVDRVTQPSEIERIARATLAEVTFDPMANESSEVIVARVVASLTPRTEPNK